MNTEDTMIHVTPVIAVCRGDWDDEASMCGGAGIVIAIDRWVLLGSGAERSGAESAEQGTELLKVVGDSGWG